MHAETINAVAALVGAIGWPLAIVVVVMMLRREISQLLSRLEHMNIGSTGLAFNKILKAEIIEAAESLAEAPEGGIAAPTKRALDKTMEKMIQNDPAGAVVFSWKQVQEVLVRLGDKHNVWLDLRSGRKTADQLCEVNAISSEMADVIKSLYSTYKRAIHSYDFAPDQSTVVDYVIVTQDTVEAIEKRL
ncbi:hypothetical protein [Rhizobium sp. ZW T2_16]|uniref:hypothetical protein n=1 Tax=Rhizobium sp. ZW T2_16 TaxID=3378083 RepID=UPI003853229F